MDDLALLVELHRSQRRQGPGGEAETLRALEMAGLDRSRRLDVADIGCGTGAASLVLARELDARIAAVDLFPQFLEALVSRARRQGVAERIDPVAASMDALPFSDGSFDVIWSEGAVYVMGFEAGIRAWWPLLRPGGILVVSEITWLTEERPAEIEDFWSREYPEIGTAVAKTACLERAGYTPIGTFVLPERCWTENYYRPLQDRLARFLHNAEAHGLVAAERREISLYEQYHRYYSYGFYVARKPETAPNG